MAKYNEVMDHVAVTDDMKSRVLSGVDRHFRSQGKRRPSAWLPALGTLAAAAVILFVIKPFGPAPVTDSQGQGPAEVSAVYYEQVCGSAEELSEAVGYSIEDLTDLPFAVTDTAYMDICGSAQIIYRGEEETLTYIRTPGTEDNSGDYTEYGVVREVRARDTPVVLKGEDGLVYLAFWTDGTYACSLLSKSGMEEDDVIRIAEDILTR